MCVCVCVKLATTVWCSRPCINTSVPLSLYIGNSEVGGGRVGAYPTGQAAHHFSAGAWRTSASVGTTSVLSLPSFLTCCIYITIITS